MIERLWQGGVIKAVQGKLECVSAMVAAGACGSPTVCVFEATRSRVPITGR